jgi:hypothetical protein
MTLPSERRFSNVSIESVQDESKWPILTFWPVACAINYVLSEDGFPGRSKLLDTYGAFPDTRRSKQPFDQRNYEI